MTGLLWCTPRRARRVPRRAHGRSVARSLGLALLLSGGAVALAQEPPPAPAPPATEPAATPAPPATAGAAAPAAAPSGSAAAASASKGAVMGYAYKTSNAPSAAPSAGAPHHHHLLPHHPSEAVATFTGFEMLADGGSRLFVQLSRSIDVGQEKGEARAAAAPRKGKKARPAKSDVVSRLRFVLKGTEVLNPMNEGALVTVHFNTPVVRARLVPSGHDLDLVIELRADVTPQMKLVAAKDNGAMLQVDFPPGAYLPAGASAPPPATSDPTGTPAPGALPASPGSPKGAQPAGANDSMESK